MCGRLVVAACLSLMICGGSARAQLAAEVELAEAQRLFDAFQFGAAIETLDPLIDRLDRPGDRGLLARCYELRGRAAFNLGQVQAAESDFVSLLQVDASERLPEDVSPRLIEFFDAVRSRTVGTLLVTMDPPGQLIIGNRVIHLDTFNAAVDIAAGSHTVIAALAGHREARRNVAIEAGRTYSLDIRLDRVAGSLTVATDPPGARVIVDGEFAGETVPGVVPGGPSVPLLVLDLAPGPHQLEIERPCSAPHSVPFNLPDPPVDADVGVIELEPAVATAVIDTSVDGAMIYLDGELRGRAPARLGDICAGAHVIDVRARRQRFVDRREWLAGDEVTLRAVLRWNFVLLPSGPASTENGLLSRIEAALRDSRRIVVMSPSAAESEAIAAMGDLMAVVTDDLRGVVERRAAAERLTDAINAQGVAWVTAVPGDSSDTFSLSVLARGSGVPDTLLLRLADSRSRIAAVRALSAVPPRVTRPSLGASLVDVAGVSGAAVIRVAADSSSDQSAGLAAEDVIVGVDGAPVTSAGDVRHVLERLEVGATVSLDVRRAAREQPEALGVSILEVPQLVPVVGTTRHYNLLLPDMEAALATARTPLAESAARTNLAVVHIRLRNWDRGLRELRQVTLPAGPGVSTGTVSYLTALCLLETDQMTAAEAALRHAAAAEESVLFVGGPRVSPLAQQRLDEFFGRQR